MENAVRALLAADLVTHAPGIWDPAGATLAVRAGHRAVYLSGAAVTATMLGRPDVGYSPATQIADRAAVLGPALSGVPLLADADLGYDTADNAVWTALAYERAGIAALILGDRVSPSGDELIQPRPATARIEALTDQAPGVAVIARTDAYRTGAGLRETIERCRAYAGAGAAAILADGLDDPADLDRLRAAVRGVPLAVNRSEDAPGVRPLPDAELQALGVRLVLHPLTAVLAALRAASLAYRAIADVGDADKVDRLPWAAVSEMIAPPPPVAAPSLSTPASVSAPSAPSVSVASTLDKIDRLDT